MLVLLAVVAGVLARLVFHLPNFVPTLALIVVFFRRLPLAQSIPALLALQFFSDLLLSPVTGFSAFGAWSWFTYSGYLGLLLLSHANGRHWHAQQSMIAVIPCSFAYWVWTNLGVWLTSGMYAHNMTRFLACYFNALPFLRNALLGDCLWALVLLSIQYFFLQSTLLSKRYQ